MNIYQLMKNAKNCHKDGTRDHLEGIDEILTCIPCLEEAVRQDERTHSTAFEDGLDLGRKLERNYIKLAVIELFEKYINEPEPKYPHLIEEITSIIIDGSETTNE